MFLRSLLLKIETGQVLSEKQEKSLAVKLMLTPSVLRTLLYVLLVLVFGVFILIAILGGYEGLNEVVSFIIAIVALLVLGYLVFIPKRLRIKKYLEAVNKFYETAFSGLDSFDLYYLGQHRNLSVKRLSSGKIYLLTDGHNFLFVDDMFKDTKYPMPRYLSNGNPIYLRVIDEKKDKNNRVLITLDEIEHFYITDINIPLKKPVLNKKYQNYFTYFFDQDPYMTDTCIVILTLHNKQVFRLSYDAYEAFLNEMPLKERK
ncbi:MAG: hypothetical protein ACOX02_05615 [Acholeplasmatales bacterium]